LLKVNRSREGAVTGKRTKLPKTKESELLTLLDVALDLGISTTTARRYVLAGVLPSVRIAGRIRIPREAVAKAQREGIGR
jgi:excisionase family DNA binding protein